MKNPLENMFNKKAYENTQASMKKDAGEIDKLEHPFGHRVMVGNEGAEDVREMANAIFSIPRLPEIGWLKARVFAAKKLLEGIYSSNQSKAIELNKQYDVLLEEATKTGDNSKVEAFERDQLGMEKKA